MVNVLLVGNGAREHSIAEALKRNPECKLFAFMDKKNPGIMALSEKYIVDNLSNLEAIKNFAGENKIELCFVGPEAPLAIGVADVLEEIGVKTAGPKKNLAKLESSKSFTRELCAKYNIPGNAKYKIFTSLAGMREFMEELNGQFVVKADGLRGGKGVKVVGDHLKGIEDGMKYADDCIAKDGKVVVEEKFIGEEFSLMSFTDGKTVLDTIPVQDHKRAYDNDLGPNTGGMGSYSDADHLLPFLTEKDVQDAHAITQKTAEALYKECGEYFKGVLYGGFIATKNGVKLIEYNVRLGDPEAMNVLPIIETDFLELCQAIVDGSLDKIKMKFDGKATVCKYVVPKGYPENPVKGEEVDVSNVGKDAKIYYAAVSEEDGKLIMTGSRAIGIVGIADTIEKAEKIAEKAVLNVKGKIFHRKDIGTKELVQKRVKHMQKLRG